MASRTLLALVNGVIGKVREERVSALPSSGDPTETLSDFVNDAIYDVLETRTWSFDIFDDGKFYFPQPRSASDLTSTDDSATVVIPQVGITEAFFAGDWRTRLVVSNGTTANTSYIIRQIEDTGANFTTTLKNAYRGGTHAADGEWETFTYEALIPSTVRRIVWLIHQEHPISLRQDERPWEFDLLHPRPWMNKGTRPTVAVVGRSFENTYSTTGSVSDTTGEGVAIWPIPNAELLIDYAYVKRHTRLSAETDTLSGVPDRILDLIEWKAVVKSLFSLQQSDAAHAARLDARIDADIQRYHSSHNPGPNTRHVPAPFGGFGSAALRRRYLEDEVPAPT